MRHPSVAVMSTVEAARCAAHPEASATTTCLRCGTFLCAACAQSAEGHALCGACLDRYAFAPDVSATARIALGLGLAGLVLGLAPGVVAWVLAERELQRIERGESPSGGRPLAMAARMLGWLCTALLVGAAGLTGLRLLSEE
ncbi:hypothetical protein [Myxococcus sp. Y35]|uniref:hypothetical protein n=1 Tax=Pseudomyxococcus flavus TaxID=3115648 RepID=UPI003CFB1E83